jgi:hypothetical protein
MREVLSICLILIACSAQQYPETYRNTLSEMKRELANAQKKLLKQKAYVEQLEEEIARYEIELIQREISQVNKHEAAMQMLSQEQWLIFFYQQRETLNQIIRNHPACRLEAQAVLDQILILITKLGDQVYD